MTTNECLGICSYAWEWGIYYHERRSASLYADGRDMMSEEARLCQAAFPDFWPCVEQLSRIDGVEVVGMRCKVCIHSKL